jgi:hypothetical protein
VLYEYTNKELDIIKNAFRTGNYDSIRDLPNDLKPFTVQQQITKRLQMEDLNNSMVSQNKRIAKELLQDHGGLFMKFEYVSSPYGEELKAAATARKISKEKMIGDHEFVPVKTKSTLKYEYPFLGANEVSVYSFLAQGDPYESTRDEKLRNLWIEECKKLFGPFKTSGAIKPLSSVTKSQLRDIVDVLKKLLLSDWNDVNFVIGSKSNFLNTCSKPERFHRDQV